MLTHQPRSKISQHRDSGSRLDSSSRQLEYRKGELSARSESAAGMAEGSIAGSSAVFDVGDGGERVNRGWEEEATVCVLIVVTRLLSPHTFSSHVALAGRGQLSGEQTRAMLQRRFHPNRN
ncbi:hypothetical protein GW17_00043484 [Ensete ventricosum]|nr:hypothetical protein GW17_00043484 [Ensete ventricosum]